MTNKRAGKCKRSTVLALTLAGTLLVCAIGAVLATVIVRSEDHPRVTIINPHPTLAPVATQPESTTTTAPEPTQTDDAPVLPAEAPSVSENPVPPSSAPAIPSWGAPAPSGLKTLLCVGINPHQMCWSI